MNFRGSKVFDEYDDEENQNKNPNADQRVSIGKYVDRDQNADDPNNNNINNRKYSNNKFEDNSFVDPNDRNNNNQQKNNSNNTLSDRISLIKVLISNYLKEKELDM